MTPSVRRAALLLMVGAVGLAPLAAETVESVPDAVAEYLPPDADLDPDVPTPASVLGFEVGERHARPDQVVQYVRSLAASSPRIGLEIQGRTHEGREQPLLVVSSPANLARLDEIRLRHLAASESLAEVDAGGADALPVVVWLAYSIHGNEASGANAALVVAYHLAASRDPETERILDGAIVLLDPMQNPDGVGRFAGWVNAHRGAVPVADPGHREHEEVWPGGRGNHYWFDLNRDWLFLVHPESRNRVATFQRWRPHVLGDFHEMGSDSTYFFQPGVPSRTHPLTPSRNQELTERLARYHARAFDRAGRLYYHGETFDDFYYGKGSTYPDVQGSVGVLFEQASIRGHRRESPFGLREFPFAVQNHVLTSLSTLRGAVEMAPELREHQRDFFRAARAEAESSSVAGWICSDEETPQRGRRLAALLARHDVQVLRPAAPLRVGDRQYLPGRTVVVPARQRQYHLLRSLFERRSEFPDSTFYDVSTWTLPLAYDIPCEDVPARAWDDDWPLTSWAPEPPAALPGAPGDEVVAFLFDPAQDGGPRALGHLLREGARVQVAVAPLVFTEGDQSRRYPAGTVVVARGSQPEEVKDLFELLREAHSESGIEVVAVHGGFSVEGPDLGSPRMPPLTAPRPAILVGDGASAYETGALWHLLDDEWGLEVSLFERTDLPTADLARYTHLFFTDGSYDDLEDETVVRLREWVRSGGTLVATRRAARWAGDSILELEGDRNGEPGQSDGAGSKREEENAEKIEGPADAPIRLPYREYEARRAEQEIAGAIFEVELDRTHPLAFGFPRDRVAVFRRGTWVMSPSENPFENVALYRDDPWLSGYVPVERRRELGGTAAVVATRLGQGLVLRIADDPVFRGFWLGTRPLVANALFFSSVVEDTSAPSSW